LEFRHGKQPTLSDHSHIKNRRHKAALR
jgi:hypothetical protein